MWGEEELGGRAGRSSVCGVGEEEVLYMLGLMRWWTGRVVGLVGGVGGGCGGRGVGRGR